MGQNHIYTVFFDNNWQVHHLHLPTTFQKAFNNASTSPHVTTISVITQNVHYKTMTQRNGMRIW